jgi:Na+/H+ antiporter NhaA
MPITGMPAPSTAGREVARVTESGRTPWTKQFATPIRAFLQTESGSAGVLVLAIAAALVWANIDAGSYERFWSTTFSLRLGDVGIARDLRTWINSGLMTLFFLVVGLEARREIDLGELRDRSRLLLPAAAGLVGMALPVLIYLAVNAGGAGSSGWGVAMSTDTALALGLLVLVGREVPDRVRAFLLTVFVVDDIVALLVIAFVYTEHVEVWHLLVAIVAFAALLVLKRFGVGNVATYAVLGVVIWAAMLASGVDPVVAGLAIGTTATAYSPTRDDLEQATGLFRLFREQPTPELARSATQRLTATLSPNARLQRFYHPWTSYVIVPLFGLANAGIPINPSFLRDAFGSPITWGILLGYVVGKPVAVIGSSWVIARATGGRVRPAVGWAAVTGSGTIAGIGFTVSFLIAALAFDGPDLAEAKLGVLTAGVVAALVTGAVFRATALLSPQRRAAALLGNAESLVDLVGEVDPERDHIRGPRDASVTVVEYGDFECPYCGLAEPAAAATVEQPDVRFVWRHLPLTDVHPHAQLAAEAAEAAAAQGAFWPMHDLLLAHQDHLLLPDLLGYAGRLGLDVRRFEHDLRHDSQAARIAADVESADLSGVSGTPTFFVNGQRHYGAYDADALGDAIATARTRAAIAARLS